MYNMQALSICILDFSSKYVNLLTFTMSHSLIDKIIG